MLVTDTTLCKTEMTMLQAQIFRPVCCAFEAGLRTLWCELGSWVELLLERFWPPIPVRILQMLTRT